MSPPSKFLGPFDINKAELCARNFYGAGQFSQAMNWVNAALSECSPEALSTLARIHYLKGLVHQGVFLVFDFENPSQKSPHKCPLLTDSVLHCNFRELDCNFTV
eukprot:GABV01013400.1.p1 GENE.GABV01013400.1~~GABV01013400.1.p1  ORF type:complete len:104 (+),score=20.75 GABV01013400.1:90-401(+)